MEASSSFKQELLLREYGRNVQDLVEHILTIEDRAERTRMAHLLVNLMARLNPSLRDSKDIEDSQQKLWNHLFVMSDCRLDVDTPYKLSAMEYLNDRPQKIKYPQEGPTYLHYGRNVQLMIEKACNIQDKEEQEAAIITIGKLMKSLYKSHNRENVSDAVIVENLRELSNKRLNINLEQVEKNNLFESASTSSKPSHSSSHGSSGGGKHRNNYRRKK